MKPRSSGAEEVTDRRLDWGAQNERRARHGPAERRKGGGPGSAVGLEPGPHLEATEGRFRSETEVAVEWA